MRDEPARAITLAERINYTDGNSWSTDTVNTYGSAPLSTDSHGLIGPWSGVVPIINTAIPGATTPDKLGIGWDSASHGELNVVSGGSIIVPNPVVGFNIGSTGVLDISGTGWMVASVVLNLGLSGGSGTINLSDSGLLHAADAVFSSGTVNLTDDSHFLMNGDWSTSNLVDTVIFATDSGTSINQFTTDNEGEGFRTHWTVIPEPATFGLFALMGGGILFARRRFKS